MLTKRFVHRLLVVSLLSFYSFLTLYAEAPVRINYQGRLKESGLPVSATKTMQFKIWNTISGGTTPLWDSGSQSVEVSSGLFRAVLTPYNVNLKGNDCWLEVWVGGTKLDPREQIGASLYSLYSSSSNYSFSSGSAGLTTNLAEGQPGSIPYQLVTNETRFITPGTQGEILTMGPSSTPQWTANPATTVLNSTNTWTAPQVFVSTSVTMKNILLPDTTSNNNAGIIYKQGLPFIHNFQAAGAAGHNTFVGKYSGNLTMSGTGDETSYNTGLGYEALLGLTSGASNTGVGHSALGGVTSGVCNTSIGHNGGINVTTGGYNTVTGARAGQGVAGNSFSNNSLFGYKSGYALTTGSNNILLGYQAGQSLTSGANNIVIGYDINAPSPTGNYQLVLGSATFFYGNLSTYRIGLGTTNPSERLEVAGNIRNVGYGIATSSITFADGTVMTSTATLPVGNNYVRKTGDTMTGSLSVTTMTVTGNAFSVGTSKFVVKNEFVGIGTTNPVAQLQINVPTLTKTGMILKSTDENFTNNLFEIHNSSDTLMARMDAYGRIGVGNDDSSACIAIDPLRFGSDTPGISIAPSTGYAYTGNTLSIYDVYNNIQHDLLTTTANGRVGIGNSDPTARLQINQLDGDTRDMFKVTLATDCFVINSDGAVGIGARSTESKLYLEGDSYFTHTYTADTTEPRAFRFQALYSCMNVTGSANGMWVESFTGDDVASDRMSAIYAMPTHGGNGTIATFVGVTSNPRIYSTATGQVTHMVGMNAQEGIYDAGASATVVNWSGVVIDNPVAGQNKKGLEINAISGGSESNYALYSCGGNNYFAGRVGIGTSTPADQLHISIGSIKCDYGIAAATGTFAMVYTSSITFSDGTVLKSTSTLPVGSNYVLKTGDTMSGALTAPNVTATSSMTIVRPMFNVGTTALFVKSGYTGIGTSNPGAALYVSSAAAAANAYMFVVSTKAAVNSEALVVKGNGFVGIHTSTPTANLFVLGTSTVTSDMHVGGNLTVNGAYSPTKIVTSHVTATSSMTITGNAFSVGGSTLVVRNGMVGIGTTNPQGKLHLMVPTAINSGLILQAMEENTSNHLLECRYLDGNLQSFFNIYGGLNIGGAPSDAALALNPSTIGDVTGLEILPDSGLTMPLIHVNNTSGGEAFTVAADGKVGLGTSNPASGLHISSMTTLIQVPTETTTGLVLETTDEDFTNNLLEFRRTSENTLFGRFDAYGRYGIGGNAVDYGTTMLINPSFLSYDIEGLTIIAGAGHVAPLIHIFDDVDPYNELFVITAAGNVGIGNSDPTARFEVKRGTDTTIDLFKVTRSTTCFVINKIGNVGIGFSNPTQRIQLSTGTYGSNTGWQNSSDRNLKDHFTPLEKLSLKPVKSGTWERGGVSIPAIEYRTDTAVSLNDDELLSRISMMPVMRWNFIEDDEANVVHPGEPNYHIGPMAQDFYKLFGLGSSDTSIRATDMASVAFAGMKAMMNKMTRLENENIRLKQVNDDILRRLAILEQKNRQLINNIIYEA